PLGSGLGGGPVARRDEGERGSRPEAPVGGAGQARVVPLPSADHLERRERDAEPWFHWGEQPRREACDEERVDVGGGAGRAPVDGTCGVGKRSAARARAKPGLREEAHRRLWLPPLLRAAPLPSQAQDGSL